ncbi:hypothetical protein WMY93_024588 [Mugilogobius chulae]|uniref:Uncharacterized protein n=1 Tax=Mugilogobius chulae TaxID=88201 RepID=A0AAW0N117_9GOBI
MLSSTYVSQRRSPYLSLKSLSEQLCEGEGLQNISKHGPEDPLLSASADFVPLLRRPLLRRQRHSYDDNDHSNDDNDHSYDNNNHSYDDNDHSYDDNDHSYDDNDHSYDDHSYDDHNCDDH